MIRSGLDGKSPCKLWLRSKSPQASDHLISEPSRAGFNFLFLHSQELPVAHHDAAVDYHGPHVGSLGRINQVGIDIVERYLIEVVKVDYDQVGSLTIFY